MVQLLTSTTGALAWHQTWPMWHRNIYAAFRATRLDISGGFEFMMTRAGGSLWCIWITNWRLQTFCSFAGNPFLQNLSTMKYGGRLQVMHLCGSPLKHKMYSIVKIWTSSLTSCESCELRGSRIWRNFWHAGCPPCIAEPDLWHTRLVENAVSLVLAECGNMDLSHKSIQNRLVTGKETIPAAASRLTQFRPRLAGALHW